MKFLIIKKGKIIFFLTVCVILLLIGCIFSLIKPRTVYTAALNICKTNEDRIRFLNSFGWEVEEEAYEIKTIIIPVEFNSLYSNYNDLQLSQGYDLRNYHGLTVKRWTYTVQNYPKTGIAYANLYIYDNKVIAGDVYTPGINGIMHGLKYPDVKTG